MAWQTIGHDWAVALLRQSLKTGRVAHAYLLCGPPQIGKTRLARDLARALNCTQPQPPCRQCPSCKKSERLVHPDLCLVEGEGAGGSIKIDQVRALRRDAFLAPYEGRYRVFILRRIDLATVEAANSLLKILEEPPAHVVLILTAVHAELLPATVVSRCQRLDLRPAARDAVAEALGQRGLPEDLSQLLARLSGGRLGWAFCAVEDETLVRQRRQDLDDLVRLLAADRVERLDFAWQASRDSAACRALIEQWTAWWRDLLLLCGQGEGHIVNTDRGRELRAMAERVSLPQAWAVLEALQETAAQLEANVNARLALEGLLLQLPAG